jgi:hypothetical protein
MLYHNVLQDNISSAKQDATQCDAAISAIIIHSLEAQNIMLSIRPRLVAVITVKLSTVYS